ncbi:MAG: NADH-quinone oxidoreductase subunit C [Candidatus Kryptoniota bacterium]
MIESIETKLRSALGDAIVSVTEYNGQLSVEVKRDRIVEVCKFLKEDSELSFKYLSDLCGADMLDFKDDSARKAYLAVEHEQHPQPVPNEERFVVIYELTSLKNKERLRLKVKVDGDSPICPSITSIFKAADWHEREAYDMFGITFGGHPDMRRIYMPEEYEYHPLRKDFPLMGVPGSIPLPRK